MDKKFFDQKAGSHSTGDTTLRRSVNFDLRPKHWSQDFRFYSFLNIKQKLKCLCLFMFLFLSFTDDLRFYISIMLWSPVSVSTQGHLVGSKVAGQTFCFGFLSNTLCMWSEVKFCRLGHSHCCRKVYFHFGLIFFNLQPCLLVVHNLMQAIAYQ